VARVREEGHWNSRPGLAVALRVAIVGVPVLMGSICAQIMARHLSALSPRWVAVGGVLVVGVLVSIAVSRLTSRLLPMAVLLRMTMVFPDRAPSRLKVARRTTSVADIQSRLHSPRLDEQDAATTMLALVTALGRHDRHTRGHSERVRLFCDLLSDQLNLSAAEAGRLRWAALVHDIGKLQVPTAVLNKPGKLSAREWDMIRLHPQAGAVLAAPLKEWLGPWFSGIAEHHERYDGTGYPVGLAASAISTAGRAIAVVDAFETMTASRSYKAARSTLAARAELTKCAGSHFDPIMVRAFLAISLPKLLWSVGPLAFLVNAPFLQWVGEGGARLGTAVGATTAGAANVVGVTAVAMTVGVTPTAAASASPRVATHHLVPHTTAAASTSDVDARKVHSPTTSSSHANPVAGKAVSPKPAPQPSQKPPGKPAPKHPSKPVPKPKSVKKAKSDKKATPVPQSPPQTPAEHGHGDKHGPKHASKHGHGDDLLKLLPKLPKLPKWLEPPGH
jgi:hypothetical protein